MSSRDPRRDYGERFRAHPHWHELYYRVLKEQQALEIKAQAVISVMEDWFQAIEAGTAPDRMPDPKGERYPSRYIDKFIQVIDSFFAEEIKKNRDYWKGEGYIKPQLKNGKPIDSPPDFNRLQGMAREAFVQELKKTIKGQGVS